MGMPDTAERAGPWVKRERERRGLSADDLAERITGLARYTGDTTTVSQQSLSKFEQGRGKRMPAWTRFIEQALNANDDETKEDTHLHMGLTDASVEIALLPTYAGLGGGGTGDGDQGVMTFSRDLIERELRAPPNYLLAMLVEGNSMEPDFIGGDVLLVDTRRTSLAQPGAFCLWDGDGHVVKFLEKVPGSDPAKVRVISRNDSLYGAHERLVDEINLVGRVIWFGRRIH
jgi:phage repressor protein C with HTH and peptisase S24 domain